MTGRRAQRRATRLREVLEAALEVVHERGLDGLTIAGLAGRVDASVGALYRYFPDKGALIVALQTHALVLLREDLEARARAVEAAATRARLGKEAAALALAAAVPLAYLAEGRRVPWRQELIDAMLGAPEPVLSEERAREVELAVAPVLELAASRLAAARDAGALDAGDAGERTLLLWAAVQGLSLFQHRDRIQPPARRVLALAPGLVAALLRGWGGERAAVKKGVDLAARTLVSARRRA